MKYLATILALTGLTKLAMAAPTEPTDNLKVLAREPQAWPPGYYCGKCVLQEGGQLRELRTSVPANKCNSLAEGEHYSSCTNQYCGVCVVFKNNDCQGDVVYSGGPGAGSFDAKGARSYYCM
ncbi:hypothetical protein M3J09_006691 [Ascochyta lentis]